MAECWNTRKTRHEEKDVLKNLPANGANAVERRIGVRRRTGKEANIQECEEECTREKIWLLEPIQIFLNVGFNIGFY